MKPAAQTQAPLFELLPWDTEFFGRRIGRINAKQLSPEEMTTISEWARREKIECLYLWLDPQAVASVRLAEQTGFCLTDVRLTFALSLPSERREVSVEAKETVTLRPSTAFDIAALEKMTDGLFTKARFYSDDHFSSAEADRLYRRWIRQSCEGQADRVWVAEHNKAPAGYLTCHLDQQKGVGEIGLVGVAAEARGKRLGHQLVNGALDWFFEKGMKSVEVVTQGANAEASALYQRHGFHQKTLVLGYHWWPGFLRRKK